ncbi:mitochondrial genome maintenance MGM101 [Metschnikowia bicuspidata var. bicuspidata NRRL YB-4993]|uniref:Mitochondrial genome maintenance protein MGM101 n=1 Tax=Metschnikowia bicuspidata var. bicuspidata NRRL YB-4993 TaxID=869754 RepID=A0A1A0HIV6_9ASCO|nr:mitochondrial genome maintenance MGM101 [Metschnikowia bicuspidata var. bicuspidata NRRL YB-4993]OBA23817.1 mitochondrial genome maintenance MGM101 [Metschnikowia bicuspidata var. bicuspidata NRRL YB-4993]
MIFRGTLNRQPARLFTMARRVSPVRRAAAEKPHVDDSSLHALASAPTQVAPGLSLHDSPVYEPHSASAIDWSDSFHGLGQAPFPKEASDILLAPLDPTDVEIKPDGILYLPEIKYRRILNRAFGPGGWGLAPRTQSHITPKQVSREYALICSGRLVSVARGEQDYFGGEEKLTTALEGCKSNALMRCCKDLGIASELWDPGFIRKFKKKYCDELFGEHVVTKKKKKLWKLKVNSLDYPYKAC